MSKGKKGKYPSFDAGVSLSLQSATGWSAGELTRWFSYPEITRMPRSCIYCNWINYWRFNWTRLLETGQVLPLPRYGVLAFDLSEAYIRCHWKVIRHVFLNSSLIETMKDESPKWMFQWCSQLRKFANCHRLDLESSPRDASHHPDYITFLIKDPNY